MNAYGRDEEYWLRILDYPRIPGACHGLAAENILVRDAYTHVIFPSERWAGTVTASKFHDSSLTSSAGRLIPIHTCEPFLTRVGSLQQLRDFLSHHPAEFTYEPPRHGRWEPRQKCQTPVFLLCHPTSHSWLPVNHTLGPVALYLIILAPVFPAA